MSKITVDINANPEVEILIVDNRSSGQKPYSVVSDTYADNLFQSVEKLHTELFNFQSDDEESKRREENKDEVYEKLGRLAKRLITDLTYVNKSVLNETEARLIDLTCDDAHKHITEFLNEIKLTNMEKWSDIVKALESVDRGLSLFSQHFSTLTIREKMLWRFEMSSRILYLQKKLVFLLQVVDNVFEREDLE